MVFFFGGGRIWLDPNVGTTLAQRWKLTLVRLDPNVGTTLVQRWKLTLVSNVIKPYKFTLVQRWYNVRNLR